MLFRICIKFFGLLAFVFFAFNSNATNYYISTDGNDMNNGITYATAWKTVAKVNSSIFEAGDSILFNRGDIWREQLNVPSSGSVISPIVFGAYGIGKLPIISGADLLTNWSKISSTIWRTICPTNPYDVDFNGALGKEQSSKSFLTTEGDYYWEAGYLYIFTSYNPSAITIESYVRNNGIRSENKSYIIYQDLKITQTISEGIFHSAYGGTASGVIMRRLEVGHLGFSSYAKGGIYANGISTSMSNVLIENCTIYECGWNGITSTPPTSYSSNNVIIKNNNIYNNYHNGVDSKVTGGFNLTNLIINGNLIENNHGAQSNGILITQIFGDYKGVDIFSNLITGNEQVGIALLAQTGHYLSKVTIYNNTISNNKSFGLQAMLNGGRINNNIIYNNNTNGISTKEIKLYDNGTPATTDYNLIWEIGRKLVIGQNENTQISFASYQAMGQEAHGINADPQLDVKYLPQIGSPAIDAGIEVGLPYSGSAPDIGVYEYSLNFFNNHHPIANAGLNKLLILPINSISLSGSGTDSNGVITDYLWTKISGPISFNIVNASSSLTYVTGLSQGIYQFELKVIDNYGAVGRDTVQVSVNASENVTLVSNAGVDQTITLPTNFIILAGNGTDAEETIISYNWAEISGPSVANISNINSASTRVTELVQGIYQFELKVSDNNGSTSRDTVTITVIPALNVQPTAYAGANKTLTLPVNSATLTGSATDTDGEISNYKWTKISGPLNYNIANPKSLVTDVTGLTEGVYQFELKVTDINGATAKDTVVITVNPPQNFPPSANAGRDQTITLPVSSTTLTGSATDSDGQISNYLWEKISGPTNFQIENANSAITNISGLTEGNYQFQLTVTDDKGATASSTVQITVNPPLNIPPAANAGSNQTITLPMITATLNGSGRDSDGTISSYSWTKISGPSTGTISNANLASTTIINLSEGVYQFELRVTDDKGAVGKDSVRITVNAAPNIPPTASAGSNQTITLPINTLTLSGNETDLDGTISSYLWTKISGPPNEILNNANSASATVNNLSEGVYQFELKVTDNNGATAKDTVTMTVNAAPNIPPTANAGTNQTITLPLNTVALNGARILTAAYLWTKISGPNAGTINNPSSASTSVKGLLEGIYVFQLTVTETREQPE